MMNRPVKRDGYEHLYRELKQWLLKKEAKTWRKFLRYKNKLQKKRGESGKWRLSNTMVK